MGGVSHDLVRGQSANYSKWCPPLSNAENLQVQVPEAAVAHLLQQVDVKSWK